MACIQSAAQERAAFTQRWPGMLDLMREAARGGASLIVAPEGTVPAYVLGEEPVDPALIESARRDVARVADEFGCVIVYGSAHRAGDGRQYNAAYVVGPGEPLIGVACKGFLWHFDRRWFAAARETEPIDTPAGRLGVLICADGRIPTISRTLAERGAQILVMPTAWVTSGRDPAQFENIQADLMIRARARENGIPLAAANKCGVEAGSVAYCGKSAIVDGDGSVIVQAAQSGETIVRARVELRSARPSGARPLPVLGAGGGGAGGPRRFAIAPSAPGIDLDALARRALQADAAALIAGRAANAPIDQLIAAGDVAASTIADVRALSIGMDELSDPAALIDARLHGIDLFAVAADRCDEWAVTFARTRAAELRAFIAVIAPERAFACDPDGTVVAGTFGAFELAAFGYDPARARNGFVAPFTDIFEGLREQARRVQAGTGAR